MTSDPVSRRAFLTRAGGVALAGLSGSAVLAACGSSGSKGSVTTHDTQGSDESEGSSTKLSAFIMSIEPYASPDPQRLAFVVADSDSKLVDGPPATISLTPPHGTAGPAMSAPLHSNGLPEHRGVYALDVALSTPGVWQSEVVYGRTRLPMAFEVTNKPTVPTPGMAAPRASSPTLTDPLGVNPICTRDPQCPLHTVSLAQVIGRGSPVAVMFATPARCQSRFCGPVLDELLALRKHADPAIALVHVEIYKDLTSQNLVPTVDAWNLPGEPWLFGIDGTGKVVSRLDGAFGSNEVRTLLGSLTS